MEQKDKKKRATIDLVKETEAIYDRFQTDYTARFSINAALIALDKMDPSERDDLVRRLKIENPSMRKKKALAESAAAAARELQAGKKQSRGPKLAKPGQSSG